MDAKDKLRIYLEQRRDLGESELLLDSMSVDDALRTIGAIGRGKTVPTPRSVAESTPAGDWRTLLSAPPASDEPPTDENSAGLVSLGEGDELFDSGIMRLSSLKAIAEAVEACTRCPLYKTANKGVPGAGAAKARLVCVGEAPGANEDETGLPFVGAAGALLTKILAAVELTREEVFITNVVKHRPPGNRNPTPNEIEACSPYLVRQLQLIKPKVIVAFGTFAAQTLLNTKTPIGKLRGEVHRYHGIPLVVTYHPAALLRNPSWKRPTWEDVKLARRILDSATGA
jgi:uracil-DNA glycosylase family 4